MSIASYKIDSFVHSFNATLSNPNRWIFYVLAKTQFLENIHFWERSLRLFNHQVVLSLISQGHKALNEFIEAPKNLLQDYGCRPLSFILEGLLKHW